MTRDEFERGKGRLAEQRRSAIELVEAGYQAQLRALELYWTLQTQEVAPEAPAPPPPSGPLPLPAAATAPQRGAYEVDSDIRRTFPLLPETYTRHDACRAIGYEPYRGALYRSLQRLVKEGFARILQEGEGRKAAIYQKTGAGDPPEED